MGGMKAEELRADYDVGWVRPEAVTPQDQATGQNEWSVLPVEQVADVNPRIDKSAIPDDLPVSFVPMPAVGAGDGSIHVEETRPAGEVKRGFTAFLEGDVLFAKITPCMENGKMAVVPKLVNGYGFGSTEFHVLRPKPGIDAKYLYYYISSQSFRGEAERYMTGAVGQKRVSTDYLKRSKIPVPPLDQQKRIVAEIEKQFSRLDEAVVNLKRVKANLKRYKAAVLKAAVEGRLVETEAELARREATLGDVVVSMKNGIYKPASEYADDGMPCLRMYNIDAGSIVWRDIKRMRISKQEFAEYGLHEGDLLVNRVNSRELVGKTACIPASMEPSVFESKNIRVRLDISTVVPQFINYQLLIGGSRYFASNAQQVVGMASISQKQLANFPIVLTSLNEQRRIVAEIDRRLSLVREVGAQVDANLMRAERLRQSTLARAFSPEVTLLRRAIRRRRYVSVETEL